MDDLDHRNLGIQLDLYHIPEDASGMVFWHPRGYAIYRVLEDYIRAQMRSLGYAEVRTPQLLPKNLWVQSGHWEKFSESMFRVDDGDGNEMALKPMSCPCHIGIFNNRLRSWRELPIRYAEFGACHRNESSGSMHGLMRTRAFEQDDAHVLCREGDVQAEVARFIKLLARVYSDLGFPDYEVAFSTRPAVRAGSDELWDWAEATLSDAARQCGVGFKVQPGEGAFYGPKLEFSLRDRLGRSWQCGTIQLDSVLPGRLGASYVGPDGKLAVPLMIHHAVFGSMGRFIAMLIEHHGGSLPFWLSPEQVVVAPITNEHDDYAREVLSEMLRSGIRAVLFEGAETISRRIVSAREAEIPVMVIVGGREAKSRSVALREKDGKQAILPLGEAITTLQSRR